MTAPKDPHAPTIARGRLTRGVPVLAALDMEAQIRFYCDKLGFTLRRRYPDPYAILERDGVEVHFWACTDRRVAESTGCYLRVDAIERLWREYCDNGVDVRPLTRKPWGMTEFEIIDPDGNLLRFGEAATEGA